MKLTAVSNSGKFKVKKYLSEGMESCFLIFPIYRKDEV